MVPKPAAKRDSGPLLSGNAEPALRPTIALEVVRAFLAENDIDVDQLLEDGALWDKVMDSPELHARLALLIEVSQGDSRSGRPAAFARRTQRTRVKALTSSDAPFDD